MKVSFFTVFLRLFFFIPKEKKNKFRLLVSGTVLIALFETVTLGFIALFASAVASPEAALESRILLLLKRVPGVTVPETPAGLILLLSLTVSMLVLVKNLLIAWIKYRKARFAASNESFFGSRILETVAHNPYEWYVTKNPSELNNLVGWRMHIGGFFHGLLLFVNDGIVVLMLVASLFILQPLVSVVVICAIGCIAYIVYVVVKKRMDAMAITERDINRDCFKEASTLIYGLKDVKIAGKESYFLEKFNNRLREFVKTNARRQTYSEAPVWLLETAGFFAITVTIVLMFTLMQSEPVRVFSLIALLAVTAWRVLPAVNRIVRTATHLRVVLPFIEKILEYLEPDPPETTRNECIDLAASSSPETTVSFRHKIRFQDVSFSYDGGEETVLSNISCSFYKGNIYAVIGKSGAGKSTFVDLLSGMLVPDGGHIFIDDLPLTSAGMLLSWRKNIGYVPQHPYLIDATVAENIAFGIPAGEIEMHRVRACCEQACIDFLRDLPDGIDTNVGDRGIRLSGGQRQRIAIARALYRGPDLLILDEATNAVDEKSEELIYSSLHAMKKNRVILIVAHRLSTRARVDSILRLDAGKTVDTVRHARS